MTTPQLHHRLGHDRRSPPPGPSASPTLTVSDIADFALLLAADMPAEIGAVVGAMLAGAPPASQAWH